MSSGIYAYQDTTPNNQTSQYVIVLASFYISLFSAWDGFQLAIDIDGKVNVRTMDGGLFRAWKTIATS